jgi:hypothetical protein
MGEITERTTLLADADVLIDFAKAEPSVLALVAEHLGALKVARQVLDTIDDLSEADCRSLGIEIIEVETDVLLEAGAGGGRLSFEDRLSLVVCRRRRWTCATNDGHLLRACEASGVATKRGLRLLLGLVRAGALTKSRAQRIALEISRINPRHINERVLADFKADLDGIST